jgi:hypothetical protein
MKPRKLLSGLGSMVMLSGLFMVTATATPAASQTTQVQRLIQAKLVGHTVFKASPTNLVEGIAKGGGPAAYTDDSLFPVDHSRVNTGVGGSAARTLAPMLTPTAPAARMPTRGSALSVKGLNAFDMVSTHGFNVEPPDQGLCAGNGKVIEMVNLVIRVYDANLHPVSGPEALETFFGQPIAFGFNGGDSTMQGDPRCYWDAQSRRWYLSQLDLDVSAGTSQFNLAVSTSANPLGAYNLYSLDNTDSSNPGCVNGCFGDQPLLGANRDALFISTNEFPIFDNGFNGAVLYTIDKAALARGAGTANTVIDYIGLSIPIPGAAAGSCASSRGAECWYSVQPATSPSTVADRTASGGVEYALSALDFVGTGDNRIALWAITNTSSIRRSSPSIGIKEATLTSETYAAPPSFVSQKAGPIPLGDSGRLSCPPIPPASGCATPTPQPEGPIQTNDDRMNATVYADGLIWGAVTTKMTVVSQGKVGIAYFAVNPRLTHGGLTGTVAQQGYVVAPGNNVIFPSIGMDKQGNGVMSFTLTGDGYFPTSAYTTINARSGAGSVKIAALGQSPQDSFSEYQNLGNDQYRPRWGDYSAAVAAGDNIYFATEYIQSPNCSDSAYAVDPTCGGTRSRSANWGTAINRVQV